MQNIIRVLAAIVTVLSMVASTGFQIKENGLLVVTLSNIKKTGNIKAAVYRDGDDFPNDKYFAATESRKYDNGTCSIEFQSIPFGTYAIAIYQDVNGNSKLDKGMFGIPSEPFAFSNNFRPKFGGPDFDKCKFEFTSDGQQIKIEMINSLFGGD